MDAFGEWQSVVFTCMHYYNIVRVWWLLYAGHRAVFEVRRNCFIRRIQGVSGDVGCLHMPVGLKIEDSSVQS